MTIVLKEIASADQTLLQGGPDFKGRALIAYGNNLNAQAALNVSVPPGGLSSSWGARDETDGVFGTLGLGITTVGSLETGGSAVHAGSGEFYATLGEGPGIWLNRLTLEFLCGQVSINASLETGGLLGLFVLGGKTLQSKVGSGFFTGNGANAITGVGFQPDLVLIGASGRTNYDTPHGAILPINYSYGACDGAGNQFAAAVGSYYITGTTNRRSRINNNGCFLQLLPGEMMGTLTSMDSDGFTINVSGYTGNEIFWWIALKDPNGEFKVGTMTGGDASFTPGFVPEAIMLASATNGVFNTTQAGATMFIGGATPDAEYAGFVSGLPANVRTRAWWNDVVYAQWDGSSGVASAEATVDSWGSTIGLDWTGSPSAWQTGWVAMKTSTGPGFDGCGGQPQQIYRWLKR